MTQKFFTLRASYIAWRRLDQPRQVIKRDKDKHQCHKKKTTLQCSRLNAL